MKVAQNIMAINTHRHYDKNNKKVSKSAEKLSSGYRINRSADDAAGLAISEKMRAEIRGLSMASKNCQDGISLVQTAEGALQEVQDMLQRMNELAVQAASDSNDNAVDRPALQLEFAQLQDEIDHVAKTATFNDMPLFLGGGDEVILDAQGNPVTPSDVPFHAFTLTETDLGKPPIRSGENGDMLHLKAIVNDPDSPQNGTSYNLIFGSGSTSNASVRVTDASGAQRIVKLSEMSVADVTSDTSTNTYSKTLRYAAGSPNEIRVMQNVEVVETDSYKYYEISYNFAAGSGIADLEFMFHADTAYNNDDLCEGYYVNGQRVTNMCVYSNAGSGLTDGQSSPYLYNTGVPESFSVVDVDQALAFTEKISFTGGSSGAPGGGMADGLQAGDGSMRSKPDSLSIGYYHDIDEWNYYASLQSNLGKNADHKDLGFSLYYDLDPSGAMGVSFRYGIAAVEKDNNISGIPVTPDTTTAVRHESRGRWWIQSGSRSGVGLYIEIDEMNTDVLGIPKGGVRIDSRGDAAESIDKIRGAINQISSQRAELGAYQNRLEHKISNLDNTVENVTHAESRIRDVDMAKEMTAFTRNNILSQAATAMLSQANALPQNVLTLLQ